MINESQKWPTDKKKYDEGYIRAFGVKCSCNPQGLVNGKKNCIACGGLGWRLKGCKK